MPSEPSTAATGLKSQTRLLFDKRYGWVLDEWKDPSEEALAAGRGMFCILPLTKVLVTSASQSINLAVGSMVEVFRKPEQILSPQGLKASLDDQFQKLLSTVEKSNLNLLKLKGNSYLHSDGDFLPKDGDAEFRYK